MNGFDAVPGSGASGLKQIHGFDLVIHAFMVNCRLKFNRKDHKDHEESTKDFAINFTGNSSSSKTAVVK